MHMLVVSHVELLYAHLLLVLIGFCAKLQWQILEQAILKPCKVAFVLLRHTYRLNDI